MARRVLKTLPPRLTAAPLPLEERAGAKAGERFDRHAGDDRPNWYKTARWQALRLKVFRRDGWQCRATGALLVGRYPAWNSAVADHIEPHNWDPDRFWDIDNIQSVAKQYHDAEKQKREARARRGG